jgi:hypothetical protein
VVNIQGKAGVEAGSPRSAVHMHGRERRVKIEFNGDREESKSHGAHPIGATAGPEAELGDSESYKLRHRRVGLSGA